MKNFGELSEEVRLILSHPGEREAAVELAKNSASFLRRRAFPCSCGFSQRKAQKEPCACDGAATIDAAEYLEEYAEVLEFIEHEQENKELSNKIQYLINFMYYRGMLPEGTFTFPDGETWYTSPSTMDKK